MLVGQSRVLTDHNKITRAWWKLTGHDRIVSRVHRSIERDDLETAGTALKMARGRFPKSAELQLLSARLAVRQNDWQSAKRDLRSLESNRFATMANRFEMAKILEDAAELDWAIRAYQNIVDTGNGRIVGASSRALAPLYLQQRKPNRALDAAVNCIRHGEYLYRYLMQTAPDRSSRNAVERAVEQISKIPPAKKSDMESNRHQMLSYCHIKLGDWEQARHHIREATRVQFENRHLNLAWDTEGEPAKPSFLIIGAMKSGTTALFDQMIRHPQVVPPLHKELQFFINREWPDEYYFDQFPRIKTHKKIITGEASPGYYRTSAARRVRRMLPNVKLIFIQRDPVDRAISHYFHSRKLGLSFSRLNKAFTNGTKQILSLRHLNKQQLNRLLDAFEDGERHFNTFLLLGCYDLLLESWREEFPEEQILTIHFEDFVNDNVGTMNRVFDYVGVRKIGIPSVKNRNAGSYRPQTAGLERARDQLRRFYDEMNRSSDRRNDQPIERRA